jgi:hypothetical protein
MKVSFFIFGVLLVCICNTSYADSNMDLLNSIFGSSANIGDLVSGLASGIGSSMVSADVVLNCGIAAISDKMKNDNKDLLNEIASCDPTKSEDIEKKLNSVLVSLPESIGQCLQNAPEGQTFLAGLYLTNFAQDLIKSKIANYIQNNPLIACLNLQELQNHIIGQHWDLFKSGAQDFITEMFSLSENEISAYKDHFTDMLIGITSNVKSHIDANSLMKCGSESTFKSSEPLLLSIIDEAALCDVTKLSEITNKMIYLITSIPPSEAQCVAKHPETNKLLSAFGVSGLKPEQIREKITKYFMAHSLTICKTLGDLNKKLKSSDFKGFGAEFGKIVADIFKQKEQEEEFLSLIREFLEFDNLKSKSMDKVSDILGGLASATSAKVDVKTTMKCTDEPTSQNFVTTFSDLIHQASACDLTKMAGIIREVQALITGFPESQQACFKKDPGAIQIFSALGIHDITLDKLIAKVVAYAISHFSDSCNTVKALDSDITQSNWKKLGTDSGNLLLAIFKA